MRQSSSYKKVTALVLAFCLLFTSNQFLWKVFAADGVSVTFVNGDNGDPKKATIIQGYNEGAELQVDIASGFILADPDGTGTQSFQIQRMGVSGQVIQDDIYVTPVTSGKRQVVARYYPELKDSNGHKGQFNLSANFYAVQSEGEMRERMKGGSTFSTGLVRAEQDVDASVPSSIRIGCITSETETSKGEFVVLSPQNQSAVSQFFNKFEPASSAILSDPTGMFTKNGFDTAQVDTVEHELEGQGTGPNGRRGVRLKLRGLISTNKSMELTIYPSSTYTLEVPGTDDDGNPIVNRVTTTYIQEGTIFDIHFAPSESSPIVLTVKTPEEVVEMVRDEIEATIKNNQYIEWGAEDNKNFVSENVTLTQDYNVYRADLDIDWRWVPTDQKDEYVVSIKTDEKQKVTAFVSRQLLDVTGELVATINIPVTASRKNANGTIITGEKMFVTAEAHLPIIVRGTGTVGNVTDIIPVLRVTNGVEETGTPIDTLPSQMTMDMYDGAIADFPKDGNDPFRFSATLNTGSGNAKASTMKIESSNEGILSLQVKGVNRDFGESFSEVTAGNTENELIPFAIKALKEGMTTVTFTWMDENGKDLTTASVRVVVKSSAPDDDALLKSLVIQDPNKKKIDYEFAPETLAYTLTVPNGCDTLTLTPTRNKIASSKQKAVYISVNGFDLNGDAVDIKNGIYGNTPVNSGSLTKPISLPQNETTKISVTVVAQNPTVALTYELNIMRLPPSNDSSLKTLELFDLEDNNTIVNFQPDTLTYTVSVPYPNEKLRLNYEFSDEGAAIWKIDPPLERADKGLFGTGLFASGKAEWVPLTYVDNEDDFENETVLTITVIPESVVLGSDPIPTDNPPYNSTTYTVRITREKPSTDASLSGLEIVDAEDQAITMTPGFQTATTSYSVKIPYSTKELKFKATPSYPNVYQILLSNGKDSLELKAGEFSKKQTIPYVTDDMQAYEMQIAVTAEDGRTVSDPPYTLKIVREAPDNDSSLSALKIVDQDKAPLQEDITFNTDTHNYTVNLPYETEKVYITPTAASAKASSIRVNGKKVESGKESGSIRIDYPGTTKVTVEVRSEDEENGTVTIYTLSFTRGRPSKDAQLKSLEIDGAENFKPIFIASKTKYKADVKEGADGVTITAIPNHSKATLKINGKKVKVGESSELIELLKIKNTVTIEVTAQDGRTKKIYTVSLTNQNLIEKSDNADLESLSVTGSMTPAFSASASTYTVTVTEDTYAVDILPVPADEYAEIHVYSGSKEIGDQDGNYSETIKDGANEFIIEVTSPDGTRIKEYKVTVYRNDEDNPGLKEPLTIDDVDFENDNGVTVVDISKYSVIGADVFNELREYPEHLLVLQGNDYTLQFKGADIDTLVPNQNTYDFGMSFTSPSGEDIRTLIEQGEDPEEIDYVVVHFNYHGFLPAPATFTISLGEQYGSSSLCWNYYNEERARIDYYGNVDTNTKGTFSVLLDHMSDFIVSTGFIQVAENKSGGGVPSGGIGSVGDLVSGEEEIEEDVFPDLNEDVVILNDRTEPDKINPHTGVEAAQ